MVVVKQCSVLCLLISTDATPQTCITSDFHTSHWCDAGQSSKATGSCTADPCADDADDNTLCCEVNTGEKCENIQDGFCGAARTYDSNNKALLCVDDFCASSNVNDLKTCCKTTAGTQCSLGGIVDGWCPPGKTYDIAKKSYRCVSIDACNKNVIDDQNTCCSTTKGTETCKLGFAEDGKCSAYVSGLTYNKVSAALLCVSTDCDGEKLDDTNTCCMVTSGQSCKDAEIAPGTCGAGLEYDEKKKSNKCVEKDGCDFSLEDDIHACCSPLKGAGKCGDSKLGATSKGFCGAGMMYDDSKALKKCAGASCSKANLDDVKTCCKANDGEGICSAIADPTYCGAGRSLDNDKADSKCVGKSCAPGNVDDQGACCKDNEGAPCSDKAKGATEPGFCGNGNTYKSGTASRCKASQCSPGDLVDTTSCCKGNEGETCAKILPASSALFCGMGKVIDTSKDLKKCASAKCSSASVEDVAVCCKTAPATTTTTVTTAGKNNTAPGTTGSAQGSHVGAMVIFIVGSVSLVM